MEHALRAKGWSLEDYRAWAEEEGLLEDEEVHPGKVLTFAELAALSEGAPYLGALLLDADRMGEAFATGFRQEGRDLATPSRIAALSRTLEVFFSTEVLSLIETPERYRRRLGWDDLEAQRKEARRPGGGSPGLPLQVHLNGGTHALATGLYLAAEDPALAHYLEGDRIRELSGGERPPPWEEGEPGELLATRGYRLRVGEEWRGLGLDRDLLELALDLLARWPEVEKAWPEDPGVRAFRERWERLSGHAFGPQGPKEGLPLEYAVFASLVQALGPRGGKVLPPGRLEPLRGQENLGDDQAPELDGLVYYRGQLFPVECKPTPNAKFWGRVEFMESLARSVGGSRGRALLVVNTWRGDLRRSSRHLVYLALRPEGLPEGVKRFPEDLGEVFP